MHQPRGPVLKLLAVMQQDPKRIIPSSECAEIMGIRPRDVGAYVESSVDVGLIYRQKVPGVRQLNFRGSPFDGEPVRVVKVRVRDRIGNADGWITTMDDARVPQVVPGWRPPVMVPPRAGA